MHWLIGHPFLAAAGKEFGERTAAAAKCVSVDAAVEHAVVGDGNEVKSAVAKERSSHSAAARVDPHAKERDLYYGQRRFDRCSLGMPQTGFPCLPRSKEVRNHVTNESTNASSKSFRKPGPFFS